MHDALIERARDAIADADAALIAAGAGMGVDSGLPDFRGDEGFWKAYPPFRDLGLGFAALASPRWFARDPGLAWGFYGHRLQLYRDTTPHAGFAALRPWAEALPGGHFVFTSNVDGQFQKAGFDPDRVVECHGSIHHVQCTTPCSDAILPAGPAPIIDPTTMRATGGLPRCERCGGMARPNILMFGDGHWLGQRSEAQERRLERWVSSLGGRRVVIVELGAGTAIATVRATTEYLTRRLGATLVRLNPREPAVPRGGIGLALKGAEVVRLMPPPRDGPE